RHSCPRPRDLVLYDGDREDPASIRGRDQRPREHPTDLGAARRAHGLSAAPGSRRRTADAAGPASPAPVRSSRWAEVSDCDLDFSDYGTGRRIWVTNG